MRARVYVFVMSDRRLLGPNGRVPEPEEVDPTRPALTTCPDCQRPVSAAAERCPECGCPRSRMREVAELLAERPSRRCSLKCVSATDTLAPSYVCTGSHKADRVVFGVSVVLQERDMPAGACEDFVDKVLALFGPAGTRKFPNDGYGFSGALGRTADDGFLGLGVRQEPFRGGGRDGPF